jgi:hypothetical protein
MMSRFEALVVPLDLAGNSQEFRGAVTTFAANSET